MTQRFRIDGTEYESQALPEEGKAVFELMAFSQLRLQELKNQHVLMTEVKNAYIADLKTEIVKGRTGVDLSALFSDN
jgi:hypothetical protein